MGPKKGVIALRNQIKVLPEHDFEVVRLSKGQAEEKQEEEGVENGKDHQTSLSAPSLSSAEAGYDVPPADASPPERLRPWWRRLLRRSFWRLGRNPSDKREVQRRAPGSLDSNGPTGSPAAAGTRLARSPMAGSASLESHGRERVPVQKGTGYGQWCQLSEAAEKRLLEDFKSVSSVKGQRNAQGLDVMDSSATSWTGAFVDKQPESPIRSDDDILKFESVQDRLPWSLEKKMHLHISAMTPKHIDEITDPMLSGLPFGLPDSCDAFRSATFTGSSHGLAVVGHINRQQFVGGDGCENAWVRFERDDLTEGFDHNLDNIPVLRDRSGVIFPVTHMWIDCNFPSPACSFEWFSGRQCVARKTISLWPLPKFVFNQALSWAFGRLNNTSS